MSHDRDIHLQRRSAVDRRHHAIAGTLMPEWLANCAPPHAVLFPMRLCIMMLPDMIWSCRCRSYV